MSRTVSAAGKRKRPGSGAPPLSSDEQQILDVILSREGSGILKREIKFQTKIPETVINKAVKSLQAKVLVEEVKGVQRRGAAKKIFMGVSFTPSDVVSGGIWYQEGKIDTEFVDGLKSVCRSLIRKSKVATLEGLHKAVQEAGVAKVEIPMPQLAELLTSMVLDNEIVEVKSTGLGDFFRVPIGETCYKLPSAAAGGAAKTSIPCGVCPRIALCTPNGVISPTNCVYYNKWLDIKL